MNAAAERVGHGAVGMACDTADAAMVATLHAAAVKALGGIDILVLNSGDPLPGQEPGAVLDRPVRQPAQSVTGALRSADRLTASKAATPFRISSAPIG